MRWWSRLILVTDLTELRKLADLHRWHVRFILVRDTMSSATCRRGRPHADLAVAAISCAGVRHPPRSCAVASGGRGVARDCLLRVFAAPGRLRLLQATYLPETCRRPKKVAPPPNKTGLPLSVTRNARVPIGAVKLVKILKCKLCSSVMRRSPDLLCELFMRPEVAERPSGLAAWMLRSSSGQGPAICRAVRQWPSQFQNWFVLPGL